MDTFSRQLCCFVVLGISSCLAISSARSTPNVKNGHAGNLMLDFNWPEPDPSINKFPHEASCHHYYFMLSEEDISIEKCPDGEMFDYFKHSCTAKETARCWSRRFEKIMHGRHSVKLKEHFKCPYPWGKFPDTRDCSKYHLCLHNKAKQKKCAPYEFFDKIARKCVAQIDATCADKTDVVEPDYKCPKYWGSFPFSKDCSKYYECLERKPTLRTCEQHMLFDGKRKKCVLQKHAHCGSRYNPSEKMTIVVQTQELFGRSTPVVTSNDLSLGKRKKESEETSFAEKTSELQLGSRTLHPDAIKELNNDEVAKVSSKLIASEVTSPEMVSADSDGVPMSENKDSSSDVSSVSSKPIDTNSNYPRSSSNGASTPKGEIKSYKDSSSEFIEVSANIQDQSVTPSEISAVPETTTSHEGHLTSASAQDTTPDAKHICRPEDATCATDKDGNVIRCPTAEGLHPHPKDETRFLHCTSFTPHIKSCPEQLLFDQQKKRCLWKFIL